MKKETNNDIGDMMIRWFKVGFVAIVVCIISLFLGSIGNFIAIGSGLIFLLYPTYEIWKSWDK